MQDYLLYKEKFDSLMGVKLKPDRCEMDLFKRAEKYIRKLTWIPGLRMIAVVNSLSMYATHKDSDIDLFIVTSPGTMWFVRVMVTLVLSVHGVWRHGEDIAGNFCLSFFTTEDAMDMGAIAIKDDIYLYFWMYYMKPMFVVSDAWEKFKMQNAKFATSNEPWEILIQRDKSAFGETIAKFLDSIIHPFGEGKSRRNWEKKGKPEGVIISPDMLKFHDQDRRKEIREKILTK